MDRRRRLALPLLALALMGSRCEFSASVNNPPPSSEEESAGEGTDPGGLIIVVDAEAASSRAEAPAPGALRAVVAPAVSTSVLRSSAPAAHAAPIGSSALSQQDFVHVAPAPARPGAVVPEPSGFLLFASGTLALLAATSIARRLDRGRRDLATGIFRRPGYSPAPGASRPSSPSGTSRR